MKSKRARELIENGKFSCDEIQAYVLPESYVEIIVVQAEQDAEEHAVKVFEQWCETWLNPLPTHIRETAANSYKQLLIGEQSNE